MHCSCLFLFIYFFFWCIKLHRAYLRVCSKTTRCQDFANHTCERKLTISSTRCTIYFSWKHPQDSSHGCRFLKYKLGGRKNIVLENYWSPSNQKATASRFGQQPMSWSCAIRIIRESEMDAILKNSKRKSELIWNLPFCRSTMLYLEDYVECKILLFHI